jgi:ribose/xylose/arabinose/galactoside ABC-type transport system permease subunit
VVVGTRGLLGPRTVINVLILALIWVGLAILTPRFLTVKNLSNVLRQISPIIVVGSFVTLLMVSRAFDLSVGGVLALSASTAALLANEFGTAVAVGGAMLLGGLVGVLNAGLVVGVGINALIATLATMYISRGSALLITGGIPIYQVPRDFTFIGQGYVGPVPVPVLIMVVVVVLMTVVERRTLLGQYSVATGSNPQAAHLAGVPTRATRTILFTLSGTAAGFAGAMTASRLGSGIPTAGVGFEFEVIVATVLGGTSLLGGEGTVIGMVLGALIVGSVNNGMNILGIQSFWQTVVLGVVLVIAVGLDSALRTRARQLGTALVRRRRPEPAVPVRDEPTTRA